MFKLETLEELDTTELVRNEISGKFLLCHAGLLGSDPGDTSDEFKCHPGDGQTRT